MDRYDIEDDDEDDGRILQDGQALRVSLRMMDSLQRSVAGLPALHQPGFASDAQPVFDEDAETARQEAYAAYDAEAGSAWMRDEDRVVERDSEGRVVSTYSRRRRKSTRRDRFGRVRAEYEREEPDEREFEIAGPLSDAESIRDAAYAEYDQEISNAWRTDE
jgi:hypothetical protein